MIRVFDPLRDAGSVRRCFVELQDFERRLDPRIPAGETVADAYLERMFQRCRAFDGAVLVAEQDGAIVGFVTVWTRYRSDEPDDDPGEYAFVSDLVVLESHRGRGIGRALLRAAEQRAREAGTRSLLLSVKAGNTPATSLYGGEGFETVELYLEKQLAGAAADRKAPVPEAFSREEGRRLFGRDAARYDAVRPGYPERVYELLALRCGLAPGCATLEVGPGSGQATRRLLALGARPLVAVEPDPGFAEPLEALARSSNGALHLVASPFETAELEPGAFDLAVCATSFHWLDPAIGPERLGACLRPGGWLALFWNVFGDPQRADPFHEATAPLLSDVAPSVSQHLYGVAPYALDRHARRRDLEAAGAARDFGVEEIRWTLSFDTAGLRALYATWSSVARLPEPERERLLDGIARIADERFGGTVERQMVTAVYLGRR